MIKIECILNLKHVIKLINFHIAIHNLTMKKILDHLLEWQILKKKLLNNLY